MEQLETPEHILRKRKGNTSSNLFQVSLCSQATVSRAFLFLKGDPDDFQPGASMIPVRDIEIIIGCSTRKYAIRALQTTISSVAYDSEVSLRFHPMGLWKEMAMTSLPRADR